MAGSSGRKGSLIFSASNGLRFSDRKSARIAICALFWPANCDPFDVENAEGLI